MIFYSAMLRYYVFFYLFCASVTLYIGYRDIVSYDAEPPEKIQGKGGSEDMKGRRKRRDIGDSRTLGFDLLMEKVEELRRVDASLRLQKLQQHNPERFKQKTEQSKKKEKPDEDQSSMNPDLWPQSASVGSRKAGKSDVESGGRPGSSQGRKDSGGRDGKSRKKRNAISNAIKSQVKDWSNSKDTEMGGTYLQVNRWTSVA